MLDDLDPYTVYWNEQEVEDARINNSGVYTGIGATVRNIDRKLFVLEPFKGFPADIAGLKAGDQWCLCAVRWREADQAGVAPPLRLEATHQKALKYVPLKRLHKQQLR